MLFVLLLFITIVVVFTIRKHKKYGYNTKKDHLYHFTNGTKLENHSSIDLTKRNNKTIILEITIRSNIFGFFLQPTVFINSKKCHLEHSARGKRYIDLTPFAGSKITLKPIRSTIQNATMFSFDSIDIQNKNILVLAPHADDAEIAAYGLYKSAKQSTIVTICAGENHHKNYTFATNSAKMKAKLRSHDAITVANIAGVPFENCVNLGYFNRSLKFMSQNRTKLAASQENDFTDMLEFRRTSHAYFATNDNPKPNHASLIKDLQVIIDGVKPDLIITPHPQIDRLEDHRYTTFALLEALKDHQNYTLLTYTNHLIYNDFYPYGAMGSISILAPNVNEPFEFDYPYSHTLPDDTVQEKFFALEAMHDLRSARIHYSIKKAFGFALKSSMDLINERDSGYFKRAVRPNEIFYVTTSKSLCNQLVTNDD